MAIATIIANSLKNYCNGVENMNDFLIDLCEWLKEDIWSKKILFIRNRVAGNQILRMAASHGAPAVNVTP